MEMRRWGERYVGFGRYVEKKGVDNFIYSNNSNIPTIT